MIISASRRTDIPALYPQWFVNRLLAGEVLVPNPYNRKKVARIRLSPDVVDCFVFWTKNPEPMLPYLKMIDMLDYQYYFEMTITDYGKDVEPNLPSTEDSIASFILLSERLGKERIDFRFDPIILNEKYSLSYHLEKFDMMCSWLLIKVALFRNRRKKICVWRQRGWHRSRQNTDCPFIPVRKE